jgi:hypothetical protein
MDVAGVATATAISQCISAFLVVACLVNEDSAIRLRPAKLKIHKDKLGEILKIGLPAGIQRVLFSLSNVIIQSSVNTFGAIIVAGNSAASNIEGFIYVSMNAFYQATISFTSQNMGAKQYKKNRADPDARAACVVAVGLVFGNAAVLFGRSLHRHLHIERRCRLKRACAAEADCGHLCALRHHGRDGRRAEGRRKIRFADDRDPGRRMRRADSLAGNGFSESRSIIPVQVIYFSYPLSWTVTLLAHIVCFAVVMHRILKKPDADCRTIYTKHHKRARRGRALFYVANR